MKSPYPPNWNELSLKIRTEANHTCQTCLKPTSDRMKMAGGGRWCDLTQSPLIWHNVKGEIIKEPHPNAYTWIIKSRMQVAHLGLSGDKSDRLDVRPENLRVVCQGCHLRLDEAEHLAKPHMLNGMKSKKWTQNKLPAKLTPNMTYKQGLAWLAQYRHDLNKRKAA